MDRRRAVVASRTCGGDRHALGANWAGMRNRRRGRRQTKGRNCYHWRGHGAQGVHRPLRRCRRYRAHRDGVSRQPLRSRRTGGAGLYGTTLDATDSSRRATHGRSPSRVSGTPRHHAARAAAGRGHGDLSRPTGSTANASAHCSPLVDSCPHAFTSQVSSLKALSLRLQAQVSSLQAQARASGLRLLRQGRHHANGAGAQPVVAA